MICLLELLINHGRPSCADIQLLKRASKETLSCGCTATCRRHGAGEPHCPDDVIMLRGASMCTRSKSSVDGQKLQNADGSILIVRPPGLFVLSLAEFSQQ